MFRYDPKPRRSKAAGKTGFPARKAPRARQSDDVYRVFFSLVMLAFAARLLFGCIGALGGWQPVAQVGDRLDFGPAFAGATGTAVNARLVATPWSVPGRTCRLDTATMNKRGGAMTVLAVRHDGVMLSWAGGATAPGAEACGRGQSVLLAAADYQQLWTTQTPRRRLPSDKRQ